MPTVDVRKGRHRPSVRERRVVVVVYEFKWRGKVAHSIREGNGEGSGRLHSFIIFSNRTRVGLTRTHSSTVLRTQSAAALLLCNGTGDSEPHAHNE